MAGEWLKFESNTPEKQETLSITVAMGWDDPDLTVGKLLKIWRWFDQQTLDGNAARVTFSLLDRISGVTGFAQAMCDVGWLAENDAGVSLPNFDRHNGTTAKTRAQTAKRVSKYKGNAQGNGDSVSSTVSGALPKEEKRREEKELNTKDNDSVSPVAGMPMREVPPMSLDPAVVLSVALRRQGVVANSVHPAVQDWANRGVTVETLTEAVTIARDTKGNATIPPNYLVPIVDSLLNPPAARTPSQSRAAPVNEKFNFGHLDRSGDKLAMAESMKRHNITVPDDGEEIDI